MAEGGVPLEPESEGFLVGEYQPLPYEEIDSLDLLFARDLITYVMRRQIPYWNFGLRYGRPCIVTPFSFRIRNAVEFYLVKENINLYFLFNRAFVKEAIDYGGYINVVNYLVFSVLELLETHNELLRLLCIYAHFTLLAFKQGVEMAPYYAFINIQDILRVHIAEKKLDPDYFYVQLGLEAEHMIHVPSPIDLNQIF